MNEHITEVCVFLSAYFIFKMSANFNETWHFCILVIPGKLDFCTYWSKVKNTLYHFSQKYQLQRLHKLQIYISLRSTTI